MKLAKRKRLIFTQFTKHCISSKTKRKGSILERVMCEKFVQVGIMGECVDIIVSTRSSPLPDTSPEPAAALASSKSEKLTSNIFPDIELHVTRLILIPLSLNKIESEELVVDDVEKSFDNNEVSYENLGETIAVTNLGELFNNQNYSSLQLLTT